MRKRKIAVKVVLIILLVTLPAIGMFIFQEGRYSKIIDEKDQIKTDIQAELIELQNRPMRSVIALNKNMGQGQEIKEDDLLTLMIEESALPENIFNDKENVIGKRLKTNGETYQYLTSNSVYTEEDIPDDLREKEYAYLIVPQKLEPGDTVDLRIKFPSGQDYVVLSKKVVTDIERTYNDSNELIKEKVWINQDESETIRIGSAVVDAYLNGAELYLIEYVDPYIQDAALVTYPKNFPVLDMIASNASLIDIAEKELENRQKLEQSISEMYKETKIDFTTPTINQEDIPQKPIQPVQPSTEDTNNVDDNEATNEPPQSNGAFD